MRRVASVLALPAIALLLNTSCSSTRNGTAELGPVPASSSSDTPPSSGAPVSAEVDPCTLLVPGEDLADYGHFYEPERNDVGGGRSCSWQRDKENPLDEGLIVGLNIRDEQSVDSVNDVGGGVKSGEVNERAAAMVPNPSTHNCTLAVAVDNRSRIDVLVTNLGDTERSCRLAQDIAYLVEPRLPKPDA